MTDIKKPSRPQIRKLGERYAELTASIDALTKERDTIKASLVTLDPGEYDAGDAGHVVIGTTTTIDTALTTKKFPAAKFPDFYKLVFDVTEFRRSIAANEIGPFTKTSPRISVK